MITPVLVKPEAMEGTGFLGQAAENVYHLEDDDLYLVGTSEVPLAAYHMDEILDPAALPLRYAGWSSCFRREAGSYGKDTRGIIRVHQFDKVEMFCFVDPRRGRGGAPAAAGLGAGDAREDGDPLPRHRRGHRRPRLERGAQVRLRGLGADAGAVPRADVDLELHDVPGPPPRHPLARRRRTATPPWPR